MRLMDAKTIMFAGVGLFISATATMVWVDHDMKQIRAQERAELVRTCQGIVRANAAAAPTGAIPAVDDEQATKCLRVNIDLRAASGAADQPALQPAGGGEGTAGQVLEQQQLPQAFADADAQAPSSEHAGANQSSVSKPSMTVPTPDAAPATAPQPHAGPATPQTPPKRLGDEPISRQPIDPRAPVAAVPIS